MSDFTPDVEKVRREQIRWFLLRSLWIASPVGAHSRTLLAIIQGNYQDATHEEIRRALDYLEERQLVKIARDPCDQWHAELTRHGYDVVEYAIDVQPGIARPPKSGA